MEVQQAEFEINYIKKLMEESRRSLAENGIGYILWGVLVVIGIVFNYLRITDVTQISPLYVWIAVVGTGWAVTFYWLKKEKKMPGSKSVLNRILGSVWVAAGIGMTLIGFPGTLSNTLPGYSILPMMCLVLGIAYYVSGAVYGEKWIKLIGLGWWAAAALFMFWKNVNSLLIFAALMILFQVIPGIYFYKKWKEYKVNEGGVE
ncbi:MAG TPA: hypothetical protein VK004_04690 [Ignavibacteria bacterium]|nr:hypothetical protein [Ignavibacteria bacterium]